MHARSGIDLRKPAFLRPPTGSGMSCTGAICGSSDEDRLKSLEGKHLRRRNSKREKRNAAAASASPGYVVADDGNVSQLAAHGGNDLRTLQLTNHDEVVEEDIQGATVAPSTATSTAVAPSPESSKASAGGLFQNWPNYDPQAYYAQVFQNNFPATDEVSRRILLAREGAANEV